MSSRRKFLKNSGMMAAGLGLSPLLSEEITVAKNNLSFVQEAQIPRWGPDDGPNQPFGVEKGINPGRVVWAWDPNATNSNAETYFWENTNNELVYKMFRESVLKLTSKNTSKEAWDAIFKYFNKEKKGIEKGYTRGEKIFVKINQTTARGTLRRLEGGLANGYERPDPTTQPLGACEQGIASVLALLRELVNEAGVAQEDILIADPQNPTWKHNADAWWAEFPNVKIGSKMSTAFGRTLLIESEKELLFLSNKVFSEKLYTYTQNADYLINVSQLKPHKSTGITMSAKNHFGSHTKDASSHFHQFLPIISGRIINGGYKKYRILTDLMGSKYLGRNTLIHIVDGLFGGGSSETREPVKYFMPPFNNDWANTLLMSLDQVALESVCYDFLRTEWNGVNEHHSRNNSTEFDPNANGVDDYLHQAADSKYWPEGIVYDPDNSGTPIPSLGVHEHWNNPINKQYSRNLGKNYGIELVSIPENLVGGS